MPADPFRYFRVEARELLDQLGKGALDLEKEAAPDVVARLLRLAHTLKGAARVVKQRDIAELAHAVEGELAPLRDASAPVPRDVVDRVLGSLDAIGRNLAALAPAPTDTESGHGGNEIYHALQADVIDMDELINGLAETRALIGSLHGDVKAVERARGLAKLLSGQQALREGGTPASDTPARHRARTLAEDLGNALTSLERTLATSVVRLDRELGRARRTAERLRLAPAGVLFTTLERAARDTARLMGKRVVFEGRGGEVRLDAHVLARIQRALLQIVGNAVAHGIETETDRARSGKPLEGRIVLDVVRRGPRVAFSCSDDGMGVDVEAMRRVVERRGLPTERARALGAEELLRLALMGGFSTSRTVTEAAGRGIGLDVVRDAAELLGGQISVRTAPGKGTTIELVVPLSLASLQGLLVEAGGVPASIPLNAVRRALRLGPADVAPSPEGESIVYQGAALPFLPLQRIVHGGTPASRPAAARSAIIVEGSDGLAAIGVERLLGTAHIVLRPLPELAPARAFVAGASLDAEGTPQLVLDPDGLVAEARRHTPPATASAPPRRAILVVDDSLTTRMLEQSILESAGYEVDAVTSGEEGLEKARTRRYSLFLVDVEMPGMDGFTFIECARADAALREVPAILVTSRASAEDRQRGAQVGAQGYVVKSEFEQTDLLARIRRLVE